MIKKAELPNWRSIKIQRMSGGGFLVAMYPSGDVPIRPAVEQAFSKPGEVLGWLKATLELEETE